MRGIGQVPQSGSVHMWMTRTGKSILGVVTTLGRAQSYVRPFDAANMATGPDEIRKSDPNQNRALAAPDTTLAFFVIV